MASRVLPTPPGPVIVVSRPGRINFAEFGSPGVAIDEVGRRTDEVVMVGGSYSRRQIDRRVPVGTTRWRRTGSSKSRTRNLPSILVE